MASPTYNQDSLAFSSVSRTVEGPSSKEWERHKNEIRRLYEKKPLKDVRAILERNHGFRATYVLTTTDLTCNLIV
jgi:hypothetical protein